MSQMQPRRQSYADEEIVVKPSTELIADEYEHFNESPVKIAVHTFASSREIDQENIDLFLRTLAKNGFDIKPENCHSLETDNYSAILDNICLKSDHLNGLILFFSGYSKRDGELEMFDGTSICSFNIQQIWKTFNSYNCLQLKNKPKIFIFEITSTSAVTTDNKRMLSTTYELAYDTPAEADILIVYNRNEGIFPSEFIESICDNIDMYGQDEDIISLVTCIAPSETRPILISTLTRKFYFTASDVRGYHLTIHRYHEETKTHLKEVKHALEKKFTDKKEKRHFFSSFNFGKKNSTKEKSEERKETPKAQEKVPQKAAETAAVAAARTSIRRPSVVSLQNRNRTISQTEAEGPRSSLKKTDKKSEKPAWKY